VVETEEFLEMTDGFNLFVRHWTPRCDAEKAILCIHGFGGHSGGFRIFGESLATWGVDVYALDLRGFGNSKESDLPRGDTKGVERHLQDLYDTITICRSPQCRKLYVLGHSLGALYTLWIGANYPESSDGLILAAPAVEVKPRISEETRERFRTLFEGAPETMIETRAVAPPDPLRTTQFSVRYLVGLSSALLGENVFRNAANINAPTLIVQGEADEEAAPSGAKRLFEAITAKDKLLKMLPGVDHFLWGSKELVCSAVMDWLRMH
jgi:alpha-beta hydrolase superfamily lysophospholipase